MICNVVTMFENVVVGTVSGDNWGQIENDFDAKLAAGEFKLQDGTVLRDDIDMPLLIDDRDLFN